MDAPQSWNTITHDQLQRLFQEGKGEHTLASALPRSLCPAPIPIFARFRSPLHERLPPHPNSQSRELASTRRRHLPRFGLPEIRHAFKPQLILVAQFSCHFKKRSLRRISRVFGSLPYRCPPRFRLLTHAKKPAPCGAGHVNGSAALDAPRELEGRNSRAPIKRPIRL